MGKTIFKNFFIIGFIIILTLNSFGSNIEAERHISNGKVLLENGNPQEAILEFQKALTYQQGNCDAIFYIGIAYHHMGELDLALERYQKLSELLPEYPVAYYYMGVAYYEKGDINKALDYLDKAIDVNLSINSVTIEGDYSETAINEVWHVRPGQNNRRIEFVVGAEEQKNDIEVIAEYEGSRISDLQNSIIRLDPDFIVDGQLPARPGEILDEQMSAVEEAVVNRPRADDAISSSALVAVFVIVIVLLGIGIVGFLIMFFRR